MEILKLKNNYLSMLKKVKVIYLNNASFTILKAVFSTIINSLTIIVSAQTLYTYLEYFFKFFIS